MNFQVGAKWVMKARLGAGSFGEIYSGEQIYTSEPVAIKIEATQTEIGQLANECRIYKILAGSVGIPTVHWYGSESDYNAMVMQLLGSSLESLFQKCGRRFSLKTVLMIADQLLSRIEYLHTKNFVHRDIKPDNFVMGLGVESNIVYIIDLGLAKKFRDSKTHQHIPFREGKSLTGTVRFTSINTHLGLEQSRRDDMEGIAYALIYLLKGTLPWMGLQAENRAKKRELISQKKLITPIEVVCEGLPPEFAMFLGEVKRLDFVDAPNYAKYRAMFRDLFSREGFVYDAKFDWTDLPPVVDAPGSGLLSTGEKSDAIKEAGSTAEAPPPTSLALKFGRRSLARSPYPAPERLIPKPTRRLILPRFRPPPSMAVYRSLRR